jgi:hypothetical protein
LIALTDKLVKSELVHAQAFEALSARIAAASGGASANPIEPLSEPQNEHLRSELRLLIREYTDEGIGEETKLPSAKP